ncbi:MAG: ferritin family protein [Tissierellia bacterium]|jgi:rubrerythrin|nr:ferritin family protein [Tissierellia bacterium]
MKPLEFAIKMELDGEQYYLKQAKINEGNSLKTIFLNLARDERKHANILENKAKELDYELKDSKTLEEYKNVFEDLDDFQVEIKEIPSQLDAYRMALEKEKESIELYEKMLEDAVNEKEEMLFKFLIKEEKEHYRLLNDLVLLVSRPEEWVESAEFGLREDY